MSLPFQLLTAPGSVVLVGVEDPWLGDNPRRPRLQPGNGLRLSVWVLGLAAFGFKVSGLGLGFRIYGV